MECENLKMMPMHGWREWGMGVLKGKGGERCRWLDDGCMDCALAPWLTTAGIGAALSCRVFCNRCFFLFLWYGRWYVLSSQVCDDGFGYHLVARIPLSSSQTIHQLSTQQWMFQGNKKMPSETIWTYCFFSVHSVLTSTGSAFVGTSKPHSPQRLSVKSLHNLSWWHPIYKNLLHKAICALLLSTRTEFHTPGLEDSQVCYAVADQSVHLWATSSGSIDCIKFKLSFWLGVTFYS